MPKFISGSSGNLYAKDDKSSVQKKEDDEILAMISNQTTRDNGAKKPSAINKKGTKEKQKSSLDLFKEELRRLNEERDGQRNKLKGSLSDGTQTSPSSSTQTQVKQPVPLPLRPDPRCPTALTLKVNLNPREKADGPSMGSFDTGDPTTTNLYVGNLNPIVTENDLCDIFGKFGPLASIKIMWPRTEEERARNRNSGFVAYMSRVDADRALKTLIGLEFKNYEMKLGWSKAVPLPKEPVFIPKDLQDLLKPPSPSGMPFNAQLHISDLERGYKVPKVHPKPPANWEIAPSESVREFFEVLERATVHVHVPQNRQVLDRIHKTIEYCLREGPVFEAIIIARESGNPQYEFLYEHQSLEHVYYRWKLYSLLHGEDPHQWRTEPFKLYEGGPWWRPPPLNPFADGMPIELVEKLAGVSREILSSGRSLGDTGRKLEILSESSGAAGSGLKFRGKFGEMKVKILSDMLSRLLPTKASVGATMLFCIQHSDAAEEVIKTVEQAINQETSSTIGASADATKIAQLYLISDILHNSSAAVTNASFYQKGFQVKLNGIFEKLGAYLQAMGEDQQRATKFKKQVMSVLGSWNHFHIYESKFLVELSDILLGGSSGCPVELPKQALSLASFLTHSSDHQQPSESNTLVDEELDGEEIDDETLAACLESHGLSLRWYKTLELSDDDEEEEADSETPSGADATPGRSPSTPTSGGDKPVDERVRFKASKWEIVDQEAEEHKSPKARMEPIKTLTANELLKQQMQKQDALSSADEYESLGSDEDPVA